MADNNNDKRSLNTALDQKTASYRGSSVARGSSMMGPLKSQDSDGQFAMDSKPEMMQIPDLNKNKDIYESQGSSSQGEMKKEI